MTLRPSQLSTLLAIASYPDGAMASDISYYLDLSIPAAEARIERLAALGLVEPIYRPLVSAIYVLTEKGRDCVRAVGG